MRHEIGLGGELMHRGYYCPSLIEDVVVGNTKRGRISKRTTSKAKEPFVKNVQNREAEYKVMIQRKIT